MLPLLGGEAHDSGNPCSRDHQGQHREQADDGRGDPGWQQRGVAERLERAEIVDRLIRIERTDNGATRASTSSGLSDERTSHCVES